MPKFGITGSEFDGPFWANQCAKGHFRIFMEWAAWFKVV